MKSRNRSAKKISKTEESVFTLLCLYVLISQAFESLFGQEDILHSDFDLDHQSFSKMVNDTIHEALVYQILLKACAYLDEWNSVFGVKTDSIDTDKIKYVKKVAKPAHKGISSWKQLREFRNQAIAHNHRDKEGKNIYLNPRLYHSPQSNGEIYFLVFCLEKMTDVVNFYFPTAAKRVMETIPKKPKLGRHKFMTKREILQKIKTIDKSISNALMRQHLLDASIATIGGNPSFTILT